MKTRSLLALVVVVIGATSAPVASAETSPSVPSPPLGGPEIAIGVGYARAFAVESVAAPSAAGGVGVDLAVGLRRPMWTIGVDATHAELETDAGRRYLTTGAGLVVTFHLMPSVAYAPWIRTGSGYRYAKHGGVDAHGVQIGHVLAGIDLRMSPMIAMAPAAGVDLVVLPFRSGSTSGLDSLQASAFLGMIGRFDLSPIAE